MDKNSQEMIAKYLHDMHSLVQHGHNAIKKQRDNLKDSKHRDAFQAIERFESTMDVHVTILETRLDALGESTKSPIQDAAASVAGVAAGLYNAVRDEQASKSIRDDYTFFSQSAIAYLMLHVTTKSLGDNETAQLAERGYRDMARMVMEIDHLMPGLVVDEIRENDLSPMDVAEQARTMIKESWDRQAARAGMR